MSTDSIADDIRLVRESGLFDAKWYLQTYPDVVLVGLDPVEHYLRYGAHLGRNPGPGFDTARYLRENPELFTSGVNPLVHHLRHSASRRVSAPDPKLRQEGLRGYLDRLDEKGLAGWAIDEARPGESVELSVFADGEHLIDLVTSDNRQDLAKFNLQGERAGFTYSWPSLLFPRGTEIDVRFKRTGWSLGKSPKAIVHGPMANRCDRSLNFETYVEGRQDPVSVIVPIFNAYEAVVDCLVSLYRHTPQYAQIILINDGSSDPRIAGLLAEYSSRPRTTVVTNEVNLGYTRTINKGIGLAAGRDVVLLNSDTLVTERWLDALRYCAYARSRVATVTALSNNAGAFSVPILGVHNPCPPHLNNDEFARVVTGATAGTLLEVPTGNGFCMYIRRAAFDALGGFDEERYPRGYGEENDFCMRALRNGWRNIVSDKAFVLHKRSQSFQGEKDILIKAGAEQLDALYPEYRLLTARFRDIEFTRMRKQVGAALGSGAFNALPRILFVISTQTGGTPQTNLDLMRAVAGRYHGWLLRCESRVITLSELVDDVLVVRETHPLERVVDPVTHRSDEYDQIVADILYRHSIALLHIRHIAWHSLNLPAIARSQNIPVAYSFHDFYSVCPSLNLLDNELKYCGGICTAGDGECPKSLWPDASLPRLKHRYVKRWQEMFREFFASCDSFITTAPSAARTIEQTYPELEGRITIIPHGRDFGLSGEYAALAQRDGKFRVLVPGNIGPSKGSELIRQVAEIDAAGKYEFHFLGVTAGTLKGVGVHHGPYDRGNFHQEVRQIAPTLGVVFSIWAETYCHTLTEMWSCGIPVLGMDIGAVGDRLRATGGGWLLSHEASPEEVLRRLDEIVSDAEGYAERLAAVKEWQATEARWNDTATMGFQYRQIYGRLLGCEEREPKRLGLLYKQKPYTPATAFIRTVNPWSNALRDTEYEVRPVDTSWLLAGGSERIDALLIQRNAVSPEAVNELLAHLQERRIPYIYEIDDPLWELPKDHPDQHSYAGQEESIKALITSAALVTTSTQLLGERLALLNPRVEVVPNALDRSLWSAPLSDGYVAQVLAEQGLSRGDRPRILYMGTSSHRDDLQMILPAIKAVLDVRPELEFIQIGGGSALPGARLINVPASCAAYPAFVKWFRAICSVVTIAVAPLRDSEFNAMKSDIKALDYALAGVPCVFSAVGPYKSVANGKTGLLAQNETAIWIRRISHLLDNAELRERLRVQAGEWAEGRSGEVSARLRQAARQAFKWQVPD